MRSPRRRPPLPGVLDGLTAALLGGGLPAALLGGGLTAALLGGAVRETQGEAEEWAAQFGGGGVVQDLRSMVYVWPGKSSAGEEIRIG